MTMTTKEKIKDAVKMTDKEFTDFFLEAKEKLDKIPPGTTRQRAIKDSIGLFDAVYGSEMDVRNHFKPPLAAEELIVLVTHYFVEIGYISKESLNDKGQLILS